MPNTSVEKASDRSRSATKRTAWLRRTGEMLIGNAPWARGVTVEPTAEPARTVDRWGSAGVVGADGGDLELEGDLLADEHAAGFQGGVPVDAPVLAVRSEEHKSELQSLMRISYAVFCLKK